MKIMYLKELIDLEREKPMGPKEVLALSYRKNLRSIDYDDIKGKTLKVTPRRGMRSGYFIHGPQQGRRRRWTFLSSV